MVVLGFRSPKRSFKATSIMYINLSFGRGRTLSSTSCIMSTDQASLSHPQSNRWKTLCKTSLWRVRRERLIAQTRADQNCEFAFCAATERAQVEQDNSPSHNIEYVYKPFKDQDVLYLGLLQLPPFLSSLAVCLHLEPSHFKSNPSATRLVIILAY